MMKAEPTLTQMFYIVLPLVRRAGQLLASRQKGITSLSDAERHARAATIEQEIRDFLATTLVRLFPSHTVLGHDVPATEPSETSYQWIVTQLDGRQYYMRGLSLYTVSLALRRNGQVVLGLVFEPANDLAYHALIGEGAYMGAVPMRASDQKTTADAAVYLESPVADGVRDPQRRFAVWQSFVASGCRVYDLGLPSLGLCCVAAGAFDVLIGGPEDATFAIDHAAALLIAAEAGAVVTNEDGKPLPNDGIARMIVAATPSVQRSVLPLLRS